MAEKKASKPTTKRRLTKPGIKLNRPFRRSKSAKEQSKTEGKRRFHIFPKFLRNAWAEIKLVTWPGRKETIRLTIAVLIFSSIFGGFIAALDYGLDKLFKEVILK